MRPIVAAYAHRCEDRARGVLLSLRERNPAPRRCCSSTTSQPTRRLCDGRASAPRRGASGIAYDRRGYGGPATRPSRTSGTTVAEQVADARRCCSGSTPRRRSWPATAAARRGARARGQRRASCAASSLADPPLLAFVPEATEALLAAARQPSRRWRPRAGGCGASRCGGTPATRGARARRARAPGVLRRLRRAGELAGRAVRELRAIEVRSRCHRPGAEPTSARPPRRSAALLPAATAAPTAIRSPRPDRHRRHRAPCSRRSSARPPTRSPVPARC